MSANASPATKNWQKALGAHELWVSANVRVRYDKKTNITYDAEITIHVEDMHNFNPGSVDTKTKISDAENENLT
jgi:hypothetical protein